MGLDRRALLQLGGASALAGLPRGALGRDEKPDYTIRIGHGLAELSPDQIVSTTLYNGQCPGPLIRFREGEQTTVDIVNETAAPEVLHWHGQKIPASVDGAMEEGTRVIPPTRSVMARSRTSSEPSRRRTTTANDFGARIITPSRTAWPPM